MRLDGITVLYGGSFNPPHMGHQMTCLYLLEALGAQNVWLVPVFKHPFAKALAAFESRVQMCERLASPFGGRVGVCTVEAEADMSGRTFDTVTSLMARHPERRFALAIGTDILQESQHWYRWDELSTLVPIVVMQRPGYAEAGATPVAMPDISSTELRRRLEAGEPIDGLVPCAVADVITASGLYRSS